MPNVGVITKAKDNALRHLPAGRYKPTFELARDTVKSIVDAANSRRTAYKASPKSRKLIAATELGAWELVVVMDEVIKDWDAAQPHIDQILQMLYLAVMHVDGTPTGYGKEPSHDTIEQVVALATKNIRVKLPPRPMPTDEIGRDMVMLISPEARLVDPNKVPTPDPEDMLDSESKLNEEAVIPTPQDSLSKPFDFSLLEGL